MCGARLHLRAYYTSSMPPPRYDVCLTPVDPNDLKKGRNVKIQKNGLIQALGV